MGNLTSWQISLLNELKSNKALTITDFAAEFYISRRTVYRGINNINKYLSKYNIKIINTKSGILFSGKEEDIIDFKIRLSGLVSKDSFMEMRKGFMLSAIFSTCEPIKIQSFAGKLKVSPATISRDLNYVKGWLENKNIHLITKQGVGIYIEADESDIRKAIIDLIFQIYGLSKLISFLQDCQMAEPIIKYNQKCGFEKDKLINIIDFKTIWTVKKIILKIQPFKNLHIDDRIYIEFIIDISLSIERVMDKMIINLDEKTCKRLKDSQEYKLSSFIADETKKYIGTELPDIEICYITAILQSLNKEIPELNWKNKYIDVFLDDFLKKASDAFQVDFNRDPILKKGLCTHLMYSLYQSRCNHIECNPLIGNIKKEYEDIFFTCKNLIDTNQYNWKFLSDNDEIGYITLHIAASLERMKNCSVKYNALLVCPNGIGVSRLLLATLRHVPELNIIGTSSLVRLDETIKNNDIDVIISTVPIERSDIKTIVINPLFNKHDKDKIEKELNIKINFNQNNKNKECLTEKKLVFLKSAINYGNQIICLLDHTYIAQISGSDTNGIMDSLLIPPVKNRFISVGQKNRIKALLKKREEIGSVVLPNKKLVMYHCIYKSIKYPFIVIGKFSNKVTMMNLIGNKETIKTAFLMVVPDDETVSVKVMEDLSSALIEQADFVSKLEVSHCLDEVKSVIEETLLRKFYGGLKKLFEI